MFSSFVGSCMHFMFAAAVLVIFVNILAITSYGTYSVPKIKAAAAKQIHAAKTKRTNIVIYMSITILNLSELSQQICNLYNYISKRNNKWRVQYCLPRINVIVEPYTFSSYECIDELRLLDQVLRCFFSLWLCRKLCRWVEMKTRTTKSTPSLAQHLCHLVHIHQSHLQAPTAEGVGSHPPIRGTVAQSEIEVCYGLSETILCTVYKMDYLLVMLWSDNTVISLHNTCNWWL